LLNPCSYNSHANTISVAFSMSISFAPHKLSDTYGEYNGVLTDIESARIMRA
jgi:hypothetical protein